MTSTIPSPNFKNTCSTPQYSIYQPLNFGHIFDRSLCAISPVNLLQYIDHHKTYLPLFSTHSSSRISLAVESNSNLPFLPMHHHIHTILIILNSTYSVQYCACIAGTHITNFCSNKYNKIHVAGCQPLPLSNMLAP